MIDKYLSEWGRVAAESESAIDVPSSSSVVITAAHREAWKAIRINRPPEGQGLYSNVREAIDLLDPLFGGSYV